MTLSIVMLYESSQNTEEYILYEPFNMKFQKRQNSGDKMRSVVAQGQRSREGIKWNRNEKAFGGIEIALYLAHGSVYIRLYT